LIFSLLVPKSLFFVAKYLLQMNYLLTWNCNHLANVNKKGHIETINRKLKLFVPEIITPLQLFKETGDENER